jgi:hypothetical protein
MIKADLANALQGGNSVLEVAYVEDGDAELDVRVVPDAVHGRKSAGLAVCVLLRRALGAERRCEERVQVKSTAHAPNVCPEHHPSRAHVPARYRDRGG